jgi:hypothetical protein
MKKKFLLLATTLLALNVWGQRSIEGKYSRTDNSLCYLILYPDNTFKYRFRWDLQWDVACGQYETKGDSIFFHYQSDMFDRQCNSEGINYADTSGVILQDAIDKRSRPISARLSKNKITTLMTGDIGEPEAIGNRVYYYRRKRNR